MANKSIYKSIYLNDELDDLLIAQAEIEESSASRLIRIALRQMLGEPTPDRFEVESP